MKRLLGAVALAVVATSPALADCAGSHVLDRCVIGTWRFASGGSATWMAHNIHSAHITAMSNGGVTLVFNGDGTFSTGNVDIHTTVTANNGQMTGTGHATGQASGQWSASGGTLNFCATGSTLHQTVTVVVHGRPITVTPNAPPHPSAMQYACTASTLTTTHAMPHLQPLVTTYSRSH
jgi:hypothetical protein